jgi:CRP-like cAMP-binding protein
MAVHAIGSRRDDEDTRALPFVGEFEQPARQALLEHADERLLQKGERIFDAGQVPDRLGIVLSGVVELCGTERNPDCGVLMLAAGDLIFPMAVLYGEPCLTSATALTETRLLMLPRTALARQAEAHTQVAMALARVMGAQWRMALRHIIDLRCRNAAERLGAFLLKYYDYSDARPVELPFAKATLAARLGVSRETLSRTIQVVAANGVLLRGSRIVVLDRRKAEEFCGPEPYGRRGERALNVHAF